MNRAPVTGESAADVRRIGDLPVDQDAVIAFPEGLPGFETCREFVLLSSPEMEPFKQLRAVSGPEASFIGIDPNRVLAGYRCELSPYDREKLGAASDSILLWLAVVAIDPDGTTTANLRAPIVINPRNMTGFQVMPHRCLYALRHVIAEIE